MRTGCFTCFFSITLLIILCFTNIPAHSQCLKDQKSVLLQFKNNTDFDRNSSVKLVNWIQSNDCCQWMGVTCDQSGHVIGLDLSLESISGPIDFSLQNLHFLSEINLNGNNLSAPVPYFFANFANLTALSLVKCDLRGTFPSQILQVKTLQTLDLSLNERLQGSLPNFNQDGSLQDLVLSYTNFSGILPNSIGNLRKLSKIEIFNCSFSGPIPNTLANLTQLVCLDLSHNSFNGSIPSFLFSLPSLKRIRLSSNQFSNFPLFPIGSLSPLDTLDLSYNKLDVSVNISSLSSFSQLTYLGLASCNLHNFPALMNQSQIETLDLSDNQISGLIPNWIWNIGHLRYLNLSCNFLVGLQSGYVQRSMGFFSLDLHSNQLLGEIPLPPKQILYLDYSNNNFSSIPAEIGNNITSYFFSLSNNMLSGPIPQSVCNGRFNEVFDLSNNNLSGTIPDCLINKHSRSFKVLNLQNNNLTGNIRGTFPKYCTLRTLDLSGNHLEGQVPKSLMNCANLEVFNLGTNNINDNFPCFLANLSSLRVLVLQSNKFQGNIHCRGIHSNIWPKLQIIDLALNNFSGILLPEFFSQMKAMIDGDNMQVLQFMGVGNYYQDSVTVINKGLEMKLVKILTTFTVIDFSKNSFEGEIPNVVGDLKSLHVLNLSYNGLTRSIPSSLGNMTQLESLDLSWNKLNGSIPTTLASLTFLSVLNLSYNQLIGMIPRGPQLQTFLGNSFEGNEGLCGAPLIASCREAAKPTGSSTPTSDVDEINWVYIAITLGYTVGLGAIVGPLLYCKRWRECYNKHVDGVILRILHHHEQRTTLHRRRDNRNLIRRHQHH